MGQNSNIHGCSTRTERSAGTSPCSVGDSGPDGREDDREAEPSSASSLRLHERWWMKQFLVLVALQAGGLAVGLMLHCTAVGEVRFPRASLTGSPVTAGTLPPGTASVTAFAWIATLQAVVCYSIFGRLYHRMREHSARLDLAVRRKDEELSQMQEAVVVGLSRMAELRDRDCDGHHARVGRLAELLARAAAERPEFSAEITPDFITCIRSAAMLHDIGKVGLDDSILLKPGRLTLAERRSMERHPELSSTLIGHLEKCVGDVDFLAMAHRIALFHHERWDGTGYPASVYGRHIPLEARIVAIADVYDALSTDRVYKKARPHDVCVQTIFRGAGTQFDPRLIDVFLEIADAFESVVAESGTARVPAPAARMPAPAAQAAASSMELAMADGDTLTVTGTDTVDMSADVLELCQDGTVARDSRAGASPV